jgi:histidine triad (HIT) family protein
MVTAFMQNGGAFNDIGHYHLHVFPRYKNDGFGWTANNKTEAVEQQIADKIKNNMSIGKF